MVWPPSIPFAPVLLLDSNAGVGWSGSEDGDGEDDDCATFVTSLGLGVSVSSPA